MDLSESALAAHPAINPSLFVEPARACLERYHAPPATPLSVDFDGRPGRSVIEWRPADPRTSTSKQRKDLVEDGAIAFAALLLVDLTDLRITDVTRVGDRADYWLGREPGEKLSLLEVGGTDEGDLADWARSKLAQLRENPYNRNGLAIVTRFRDPSAALRSSKR